MESSTIRSGHATHPSGGDDLPYALGVDLGTTYTAAAIASGERADVLPLGTVGAAIPSVVVLREDGQVLVGEPAERRSVTEPARTAREFKRRLGDPAPLVLGGTPYGAEALMARLLRAVVDLATERQGEPPSSVTVTHPANYGPYKRDLLTEMARLADVGPVTFLTEPEAAAINYAEQDRLVPGEVVAVYDFGGGTFDAAVLRKTADGFELLGTPEGMERLGGIDFDQAVFSHVDDATGGQVGELDTSDPQARAALQRLRADARLAKESLSGDTDTTVPVMLPTVQTQVRLTRPEFEGMIRPRIEETIAALQRAVRSAGIEMSAVSRILLVGGSSRIPLVAEMVRETTGRPVVVDAHPKSTIALGAARHGARGLGARTAAAVVSASALDASTVAMPVAASPVPAPVPARAAVRAPAAAVAPSAAPPADERRGRGLPLTLVAGAIAVLVLAVGAFALLGGRNGGAAPASGASPSATAAAVASPASPAASIASSASPTAPDASPSPVTSAPASVPTSAAPSASAEGTPLPAGMAEIVAGSSARGDSGDGGAATAALFGIIGGLDVLPDGRVALLDDNGSLRIVAADGTISRLGQYANVTGALAAAPDGSFVAVADFKHQVIRIGPDGIATRLAGREDSSGGNGGDGGPANAAELYNPAGVAVAPDGTVYISDSLNNRIRAVGTDGVIRTVVGSADSQTGGTGAYAGDGGPATAALLNTPYDIAVGPDGSLYIVDEGNYRIRRVDPGGVIRTIAGSGAADNVEPVDGRPALEQPLGASPRVVGVDPAGFVYTVVEGQVVRIEADGTLAVLAGGGDDLYATGVTADQIRLDNVAALRFDRRTGDLFIAETTRVYRVAGVGRLP